MSVVLCVLLFLAVTKSETIDVYIDGLGSLLGSVSRSEWSQRPIYMFQGVPFAEPPVGNLRFKNPVPAQPWTGKLNATAFRNICPQISTENDLNELNRMTRRNETVEDCLHLNIYTPQIPGKCSKQLPVMFYIHGGSFKVGSARNFLPNYLLEKDVVLVVIQYRLGPLGFLSLQTEEIPGNMGLQDQLLALKWTNKHIEKFCGNPTQLTILGQSAGAAAVTLFLTSPLVTPDLFQRVIVQSGSSLCDWAMDKKPVPHARKIAKIANCTEDNLQDLANCLRKCPVLDILFAHSSFLSEVLLKEGKAVNGNNGGTHAVVQESGPNRYLTEHPMTSFKENRFHKVNMMVGVTKHEGSFFLGNIYDFILKRKFNTTDNITGDYLSNDFIKDTLRFSGIDDGSGAITDVFQDKFFQPIEMENFMAMVPGLIDICGITLLKACSLQIARKNVYNDKPTYLYSFNYKGQYTKFGYGEEVDYPFPGGVAHSDELIYLFPNNDGPLNEQDKKVAQTMVDLWTNFATYGDPTPATNMQDWPSMETSLGPYLRIEDKLSVHENFYVEYNITTSEGLDAYMNPSSSNSLIFSKIILVFPIIFTIFYE